MPRKLWYYKDLEMALSFLSTAPKQIFFLNKDLQRYLGIRWPEGFPEVLEQPNTL